MILSQQNLLADEDESQGEVMRKNENRNETNSVVDVTTGLLSLPFVPMSALPYSWGSMTREFFFTFHYLWI